MQGRPLNTKMPYRMKTVIQPKVSTALCIWRGTRGKRSLSSLGLNWRITVHELISSTHCTVAKIPSSIKKQMRFEKAKIFRRL
jgi:hypothetical protein